MFGDSSPFPEPTSRTSETERTYIKHGIALRNTYVHEMGIQPELVDLVEWFIGKDGVYSSSTIRAYRSALIYLADRHFERGKMSHDRLQYCRELLKSGPTPKAKGQHRQTSSLKRKSIPDHKLAMLLQFLDDTATENSTFLASWIRWSLTFFPRPSEWWTASTFQRECEDGTTVTAISFGNCKATNGRSFGPERFLDLNLDRNQYTDLANFIRELRVRTRAYKSPDAFYDVFRKQFSAACVDAKVPKLSPYSLRHIGMAVAKSEMDSQSVSYAAGHGSDVTKTVHYARTRDMGDGWLSPDQAFSVRDVDRALVRVTGKVKRFIPKTGPAQSMRP